MALVQQSRLVLRLIVRRPLRSALAAFGVAVAAGALVVAEAVAGRARASMIAEIARMGADVLVIDAAASRIVAGRAATGREVTTLTEADERELAVRLPRVRMVAGEYRGTLPVRVGDLARQVTVSGDSPSYAALREAPVERGRFFDEADDAGLERVAVLGARVARDLFRPRGVAGVAGVAAVLGRPFRVGGIPFTVIGVLPERGTGLDAFSEDETIFVPLKTAKRRLFNVSHLQRIFLRIAPGSELDGVAETVRGLVRARHPRAASAWAPESTDFRVRDQRRLIGMQRGAADRLAAFQVVVAVALLAAGAGGVFSLQLLAVRERRSEIGTRRALGATRRSIFGQFVAEAAIVSTVGIAGGVTLGLEAMRILGAGGLGAGGIRAGVPAWVGVAAAAGLLGSCLLAAAVPAARAARVPPAVALRAL